jgi:hypothetical protein
MLGGMSLLFDAFWRAVAYCLHPRVIALSFLPLVLMVALALRPGLLLYWDAGAGSGASPAWSPKPMRSVNKLLGWLEGIGPVVAEARCWRRCIVIWSLSRR